MRGSQRKRLLFHAREKWFSKSGGKTSQDEITAQENLYRQQTCRPCYALESNDFIIPDWSLPGVLDGAVERESSQHRHGVDCSALHVWLRLPVTVDFEFDAQCLPPAALCLQDTSKFRNKLFYSSASATELEVTGEPTWLQWNSSASTTLKINAGDHKGSFRHIDLLVWAFPNHNSQLLELPRKS